MTVSNNFKPFAQCSRWQETHHNLFFSTSHHYKQNYSKPAPWTSSSSAQLFFLHFTKSNFGVAKSLGFTHTLCSSTRQQATAPDFSSPVCQIFLGQMRFIHQFHAPRNLGANWILCFLRWCLIQVLIESKNISIQARWQKMDYQNIISKLSH